MMTVLLETEAATAKSMHCINASKEVNIQTHACTRRCEASWHQHVYDSCLWHKDSEVSQRLQFYQMCKVHANQTVILYLQRKLQKEPDHFCPKPASGLQCLIIAGIAMPVYLPMLHATVGLCFSSTATPCTETCDSLQCHRQIRAQNHPGRHSLKLLESPNMLQPCCTSPVLCLLELPRVRSIRPQACCRSVFRKSRSAGLLVDSSKSQSRCNAQTVHATLPSLSSPRKLIYTAAAVDKVVLTK